VRRQGQRGYIITYRPCPTDANDVSLLKTAVEFFKKAVAFKNTRVDFKK
jgi:hypothetical protein